MDWIWLFIACAFVKIPSRLDWLHMVDFFWSCLRVLLFDFEMLQRFALSILQNYSLVGILLFVRVISCRVLVKDLFLSVDSWLKSQLDWLLGEFNIGSCEFCIFSCLLVVSSDNKDLEVLTWATWFLYDGKFWYHEPLNWYCYGCLNWKLTSNLDGKALI